MILPSLLPAYSRQGNVLKSQKTNNQYRYGLFFDVVLFEPKGGSSRKGSLLGRGIFYRHAFTECNILLVSQEKYPDIRQLEDRQGEMV